MDVNAPPAAQAAARGGTFGDHTYLGATRSLCSVCKEPVEASVQLRGGEVHLDKFCPRHGHQRALLSSSPEWYLDALSFTSPVAPPPATQTAVGRGCPLDCGFCPSHLQDVRLPIVPITSACNQRCPICYTINNNDTVHLHTEAQMAAVLDRLEVPGRRAIINFTGGEPTLHPDLLRFLELCRQRGVGRLTVSTNGTTLSGEAYVAELARLGARIVLSLDSLDPEVDRRMLGRDTIPGKLRALELLEAHDVSTTLLPAVARGYNDGQVGRLLELMLSRPHICSLELHTMTFTGQGGAGFPRQGRITVPDLHRLLQEATDGGLTGQDFVPSPMAHPLCYSICYLLCLDGGGFVPLARLLSRRRLFEMMQDGLYLEPGLRQEEVFREMIDTLWADPDRIPRSEDALRTVKRLLLELFPGDGPAPDHSRRQRLAERSVKAIYIHSHMDEETFDVARVMRCCVAVPETDGRLIPTCSYNVLYRGRDPRFAPEAK